MIRSLFLATFLAFSLAAQRPERNAEPGQRLQRMASELNLTEDQKAQIKPILEEEAPKLKAIREDASLDRRAKMEKARDVMQDTSARIQPILTEDQKAKAADMRKEAREKAGERRGRRPRG
jgi:Spy/CpxP family protein refolding chaperone